MVELLQAEVDPLLISICGTTHIISDISIFSNQLTLNKFPPNFRQLSARFFYIK